MHDSVTPAASKNAASAPLTPDDWTGLSRLEVCSLDVGHQVAHRGRFVQISPTLVRPEASGQRRRWLAA